jgi:hypothetical protein
MAIAAAENANLLCFINQNDQCWKIAIAWLKVNAIYRLSVTTLA